MAARLTSIEVLETFRSALIVFLTQTRRSLDEVTEQVRRIRLWLQHDQRLHWEGQIRKRQKLLDAARQELMTARLSGLRMSTTAQENAFRKAKLALDEAEEKLRNTKRWSRDYDSMVDPLVKRLESLRYTLDFEMPKGVAFLTEAQKILEDYVSMPPPPSGGAPAARPGVGTEESHES